MSKLPNHLQIYESVRQSASLNYTYLNNAKVACSTIKYNLWKHHFAHGLVEYMPDAIQLHGLGVWDREFSSLINNNHFVFSFVRHPYSRAVSCFKDKILKRNIIRTKFCLQYGFDEKREISFIDFLKAIIRTNGTEDDQHWRSQSQNILIGIAPINFIGLLERFDDDFDFVRRQIGLTEPLSERREHRTGLETDKTSHRDPEAVELVNVKYKDDFDNFGYSVELTSTLPEPQRLSLLYGLKNPNNAQYLSAVGALNSDPGWCYSILDQLLGSLESDPAVLEIMYMAASKRGDQAGMRAAIDICRRQFAGQPTTLSILLKNALNNQRFYRAEILSRKLVNVRPGNSAFWRSLALSQLKNNKPRESLSSIQVALRLSPRIAEHFALLGDIYLALNEYSLALDAFHTAMQMKPTLRQAINGHKRALQSKVTPPVFGGGSEVESSR